MAETVDQARRAAEAVVVTYADEEVPILTIRDSLDAGGVSGKEKYQVKVSPKRPVVPGEKRGEIIREKRRKTKLSFFFGRQYIYI